MHVLIKMHSGSSLLVIFNIMGNFLENFLEIFPPNAKFPENLQPIWGPLANPVKHRKVAALNSQVCASLRVLLSLSDLVDSY